MRAWNLMNAEINWQAMETVVEMFGVVDVERFIIDLETVRDWQEREREQRGT